MVFLVFSGFVVGAKQCLLRSLLPDQFHLILADWLIARVVTQLNVLVLHVLLDRLHDAGVLERGAQLTVRVVLAQNFDQLRLDQHQNLADSAVCQARGHLDLVGAVGAARGRITSLVLRDVLTDDNVIKMLGVLACEVIVELTALGRDHVRLPRLCRVLQLVGVLAWRADTVASEDGLVFPGGIFLSDQALGRTGMALNWVLALLLQELTELLSVGFLSLLERQK